MPDQHRPRSTAQRIADTRHRLEHDLDLWVASCSKDNGPWLVPLSFLLDEQDADLGLIIVTPGATRTGLNVGENPQVRLALGELRDVCMIDGTAHRGLVPDLSADLRAQFRAKHGADPQDWSSEYFRVHVNRIQAWRESNETPGRTILRSGRWVEAV